MASLAANSVARGVARAQKAGLSASSVAAAGNTAVANAMRSSTTTQTPTPQQTQAAQDTQMAVTKSPAYLNSIQAVLNNLSEADRAQLQEQANQAVDPAIDKDEEFLKQLSGIRTARYSQQYDEAVKLADTTLQGQLLDEATRSTTQELKTSGDLSGQWLSQFDKNQQEFGSGQFRSFADTAVWDRNRVIGDIEKERALNQQKYDVEKQSAASQRDYNLSVESIGLQKDLNASEYDRKQGEFEMFNRLLGMRVGSEDNKQQRDLLVPSDTSAATGYKSLPGSISYSTPSGSTLAANSQARGVARANGIPIVNARPAY